MNAGLVYTTRAHVSAAALDKINVDTDQIIPKQYLTSITKAGLGRGLFHDFRYDMNDKKRSDFMGLFINSTIAFETSLTSTNALTPFE